MAKRNVQEVDTVMQNKVDAACKQSLVEDRHTRRDSSQGEKLDPRCHPEVQPAVLGIMLHLKKLDF